MKQSVLGGKRNPCLLQKEEENVDEETNDDSDVNIEANITMNEEKKTLRYKETMNVYIENIFSLKTLEINI